MTQWLLPVVFRPGPRQNCLVLSSLVRADRIWKKFPDVNGNESLTSWYCSTLKIRRYGSSLLECSCNSCIFDHFCWLYFHQISWDHGQGLKYLPVTFRYIKTIGFCSLAPKKPKVVLNFAKSSFAFNLGWIAGTIIPRLVLLTQAITKELFLLVIQDRGVFRSCVRLIPKEVACHTLRSSEKEIN